MAEQLALEFEHHLKRTFKNFYPGQNQEIIEHLIQCIKGSGEQQIYIWGGHGLGKSHLLQASFQLAQENNQTGFFFELNPHALPSPEILTGIEDYEVVCLDNIEAIAGYTDWESNFFNFYNRHRDQGYKLIVTATCPPGRLPIQLPDLKTRLNWGLTLKLQEMSDTDSIQALTYKANQLGFELNPKVGRFLLNHYARDLNALWHLLDKLDRATLTAKRKLTLPFLREFLKHHENP